MFACMECGKKFKTVSAAQRASNNGCPKCGGVDVDLDPEVKAAAESDQDRQLLRALRMLATAIVRVSTS